MGNNNLHANHYLFLASLAAVAFKMVSRSHRRDD